MRKVLFVFKRLVPCDQDIKPGALGGFQKFAVLYAAPSHVDDGERLMMCKEGPQIAGYVFIKEDLHGTGWWLCAKARIFRIVSSESVG